MSDNTTAPDYYMEDEGYEVGSVELAHEDTYELGADNEGDLGHHEEVSEADNRCGTQKVDKEEEEPVNEKCSIYVGNVNYTCSIDEFRHHFAACGPISRVTIMTNKRTHQPLGYGYIEFQTPSGVENALLLDETELKDRIIRVSVKRKNIPGRGKRGRGRAAALSSALDAREVLYLANIIKSVMRGGGRGRGRGRAAGRGMQYIPTEPKSEK